jgi:hypothetical protein
VFEHLLKIAALLLANLGCAVLGGVVGSALTGRDLRHRAPEPVAPASEPEDPEDERADEPAGYHAEWWKDAPTGLVSSVDPSLPPDFGTGMWPVRESQRLDPLEGETVRIMLAGRRVEGEPVTEPAVKAPVKAPYTWLHSHGNPDDWTKLTRKTAELPQVPQ